MTLIEVVVALAIFAILMVLTTGVFTSAMYISRSANDLNDNSHAAQNDINGGLKPTAVTETFEFNFDGKNVSKEINKYEYDENGLKYETFESK